MYAQTMISIRAVAKKLNDQGGRNTQKHRGRRDFFIYLRMFSVLSFNWIFGILTLAIPDNGDIYVPKCWVDLSFSSKVILNFSYLETANFRTLQKNKGYIFIYLSAYLALKGYYYTHSYYE